MSNTIRASALLAGAADHVGAGAPRFRHYTAQGVAICVRRTSWRYMSVVRYVGVTFTRGTDSVCSRARRFCMYSLPSAARFTCNTCRERVSSRRLKRVACTTLARTICGGVAVRLHPLTNTTGPARSTHCKRVRGAGLERIAHTRATLPVCCGRRRCRHTLTYTTFPPSRTAPIGRGTWC